MNKIRRSIGVDRFMTIVFYCIAIFFFALLIGFASYVIIGGLAGASPEMFAFERSGSIGNQLFNTLYLVFISLVFSIPIGVCGGIYLAMYAKQGPLTKFLRICIETLSSLPSIVVGLFGYLIFLVMAGLGRSLIAGALCVSILTLPLITTTTEDAINGLPQGYLQASLGLGATRWQSIFHVLLPACVPRIMTGVILAAGRGFGEAAALLYTTGSGSDLRWSNWDLTAPTCPLNIFRPAETLSLQIWNLQTNGQDRALAKSVLRSSADPCSGVQHRSKRSQPQNQQKERRRSGIKLRELTPDGIPEREERNIEENGTDKRSKRIQQI